MGLVDVRVDAQRRIYTLRPERLTQLDAWLARYRRYWTDHLEALETHLATADPDTNATTSTYAFTPTLCGAGAMNGARVGMTSGSRACMIDAHD